MIRQQTEDNILIVKENFKFPVYRFVSTYLEAFWISSHIFKKCPQKELESPKPIFKH